MSGRTLGPTMLASLGVAIALAVVASASAADSVPVFQLDPLEAGMCVAIQIPVAPDQAVSGLSWYNSDSGATFPEVLVVAGYHGIAPNLAEAIVLLEMVQGNELSWSQVDFGQDVMSPTGVFYVIFRLPGFDGAQGPGVGPGLGYEATDLSSSVFVKADGEDWFRMVTDKRLLVDPVYAAGVGAKSANGGKRTVLMLAAPAATDEGGEAAEIASVPVSTELLAPYPNPFNPQVTIAYTLREAADVRISVYDVRGRRVRSFDVGFKPAGQHAEVWYGRDDGGRKQASGVYFVRLNAGQYEQTRRLLLMK